MHPAPRRRVALYLATTALTLPLCLAPPVAAQEAADITYLGQIVIGYAEDGSPIFAGENATHLGASDLRGAASTTDLDGLLRQQTSVFTQKDPGNPGVAVNIRGFEGSGRVAMSVDGVPQSYRLTGHAAQGYSFVDENLLAGVDITRGPVTGLGGSGYAGAVDFRTLEVGDVLREGATQGGMVRLSYADNGETLSGMAATAMTTGRFDMLFAASRHTGEDYSDGAGTVVRRTDEDIASQLFKIGYDLTDSQRISLSLMHYGTDFYATSYEQQLTNDIARLGYRYDAGDPLIDLRINVYSGRTSTDWVGGTGSAIGREMTTRTTGFDVSNTSDLSLGAWALTSANGIEAARDTLGGTKGGVNPTDGTAERVAVFSENVFRNGPWEITAGLRASSYSLTGQASRGPIDIDGHAIDPKLTLAYQANDWLQPYFTLSRGTRAPTLQEAMLGGTHPGGGIGMIANPELRPETEQGYELGFNLTRDGVLSHGDSLRGRVNYYDMAIKDYVVTDLSFTNAFGQRGAAFVNVPGKSHTKGVEVELSYEQPLFQVGLSYTHTDSDLPSQTPGLGAGQYLPDDSLSLRVARHLMDGRLTLGANYTFVSGGLFTDTYTDTPYRTEDSYDLVDLFASWELRRDAVVYAKVTNVFDEVYAPWLSASATENGRGPSVRVWP